MTNTVHAEERDRASRSKNLVVYGLPQVSEGDTDEDTLSLVSNEIIKKLELTITPESTRRIGKPKEGRPRPILLKLKSETDRRLLLTKKSKLRHTHIRIHEDLTPAQRESLPAEWEKVKLAWEAGKWAQIRNGVAVIRDLREGETPIQLHK